jgi:hypothetical protein
MTITKMLETAKFVYDSNLFSDSNMSGYDYIGIRFENKSRNIGDVCECSRHNINRLDERDFPVFGSDEYNDLLELSGTSSYDLSANLSHILPWHRDLSVDAVEFFEREHCYVIAGNKIDRADYIDEDELVIVDAKVIYKIY